MAATTTSDALEISEFSQRTRNQYLDAAIRVGRSPVGAIAAGVILLLVLSAIFAPLISPARPTAISRETLIEPTLENIGPGSIGDGFGFHLLGTDHIGRDLLSRLLHGARVSLYVGFLTVFAGTIIGALVGLTSGLFGGPLDLIIQRFVDALLAFPAIVLTMAIVSVLSPSTTNAVLSIAIVVAASNSRVVRGAVIAVKENVYIDAARSVGASQMRIMFQHILPNIAAPLLILISASFGSAILIEGALSFLGLATQAPDASWGVILRDGRGIVEQSPWPALWAGSAIAISVLAFNMLGDVIRDVLDPRLRGR